MKRREDGPGGSFTASLDTTDTATEAILANVVGKMSISRLLVGCCFLFFFPWVQQIYDQLAFSLIYLLFKHVSSLKLNYFTAMHSTVTKA